MGGEISGASAALSDTLVLVTTPSRQSMRSRTCLGAQLPLHSLVARTKGSPSAKLCAVHSICDCSWAAMKTRTKSGSKWTLRIHVDAMSIAAKHNNAGSQIDLFVTWVLSACTESAVGPGPTSQLGS